jgi:hypothetical protein
MTTGFHLRGRALDLHTVDLVAHEYDSGFEYNVLAKTQKLGVFISSRASCAFDTLSMAIGSMHITLVFYMTCPRSVYTTVPPPVANEAKKRVKKRRAM